MTHYNFRTQCIIRILECGAITWNEEKSKIIYFRYRYFYYYGFVFLSMEKNKLYFWIGKKINGHKNVFKTLYKQKWQTKTLFSQPHMSAFLAHPTLNPKISSYWFLERLATKQIVRIIFRWNFLCPIGSDADYETVCFRITIPHHFPIYFDNHNSYDIMSL